MPNKNASTPKAMKQNTLNIILSTITSLMCITVLFCCIMTTFASKRSELANVGERDFILNSYSMLTGLEYLTEQVRAYAQYGEPRYLENYTEETNSKRIENSIDAVKLLIGENNTLLKQAIDCNNRLAIIEAEAIELIKSQQREPARKLLYSEEYSTLSENLQQIVFDMQNNIQVEIQKVIDKEASTVSKLNIVSVCLVILLFILQTLTFVITKRSIIDPIAKLRDLMLSVGSGNLSQTTTVPVNTSEIGELCGAIKNMQFTLSSYIDQISAVLNQLSHQDLTADADLDLMGDFAPIKLSLQEISRSLNEAFIQIRGSADQVSSGSEQVSSGSQALSQGATQQASSIQELAATIGEISSQIKTNAENATDANSKAGYVRNEILDSNQQMQNLIQAMSEISNSSSQISKVIKTIEDIAFQTNILALNAAVEAARAGASGKGFAVVADEVRNLASKSAEAAKGTTSLIENSIQAVQNGIQIADSTAKSLSTVVEGANEIVFAVQRISDASLKQANAISQVTDGMDEISSVVQTNSATAEESAATSEELSSQAVVLKSLVEMFRLKEDNFRSSSSDMSGFNSPVSFDDAYSVNNFSNKY